MSELPRFFYLIFFIALDVCLALILPRQKQTNVHNRGKDKLKSNPILICGVICRFLCYDYGYDAAKNYTFLKIYDWLRRGY